MSSKELWDYILRGQFIPPYQEVAKNMDQGYMVQYEEKKLATAKLQLQTGEYAGIFIVLLIYGGIIFLLMKAIYPISLLKSLCLSFLTYIISKIAIIPLIRFWRNEDNGDI